MGIFDLFSKERREKDPELERYYRVGEWRAKANHNLNTGNYREALHCANEALKLDPEDEVAKSYKEAAEERLGL